MHNNLIMEYAPYFTTCLLLVQAHLAVGHRLLVGTAGSDAIAEEQVEVDKLYGREAIDMFGSFLHGLKFRNVLNQCRNFLVRSCAMPNSVEQPSDEASTLPGPSARTMRNQ